METIKSLEKIDSHSISEAFGLAFIDYDIQLGKEQLLAMLTRRGFVPELSFAAFEGDRIVSFTLNGIGQFHGKKTAYDTGTGTIKDFRGKGLATKIFLHSIPFLKKAGISQYLLEVLQHNEKAVSVYRKIGFKVNREFNYFSLKNEELSLNKKPLHPEYQIKEVTLSQCESKAGFCDFAPSWQNSFDSIARQSGIFKLLGAFKDEELLGYCVFEPKSGDITQIAVDKNFRRKGIATCLITEAVKFNKYSSVKILNTEVNCESINEFLNSNNIQPSGRQFEMLKEL